jgi:hypothetical protein
VPLREGALPRKSDEEVLAFQEEVQKFVNHMQMVSTKMDDAVKQLKAMQLSLSRSTTPDAELMKDLHDAEMKFAALDTKMNGNLPQRELRDVAPKTIMDRISVAYNGLRGTYGPTAMQMDMLRVGKEAILGFPNFGTLNIRLKLLFGGKMPLTKELPHNWYNTPNIHLLTLKDFKNFCKKNKIMLSREINLKSKIFKQKNKTDNYKRIKFLTNLRTDLAVFKIKKK